MEELIVRRRAVVAVLWLGVLVWYNAFAIFHQYQYQYRLMVDHDIYCRWEVVDMISIN